MGHGARGLLGGRRRAGTTSRTTTRAAAPIAGAKTGCSASAIASAACASPRAVERARPDSQGAPVRADGPGGQPRRGRQGVLLLPRLHADALVHQGAVQVSSTRVPVRRAGRRERSARPCTSRSSSSPTPASSTTIDTSTSSRVREGRAGRHAAFGSRSRIAARTTRRFTCCRRCGFATPGRGARTASGYWPRAAASTLASAHATIVARRTATLGDRARRVDASDDASRAAVHRERDERRATVRRAERASRS